MHLSTQERLDEISYVSSILTNDLG